jgi:hypothetical protein
MRIPALYNAAPARQYDLGMMVRALAAATVLASVLGAHSGPFDGKRFKGRIAWSSDGNHNDEDDWAASPVALAIFAEFGVKGRLVHFDYNSILPTTDPAWEKEHETSVLGAVARYGYDRSVFHDCRKDVDAAVNSIARAINESSADNPLYLVIAGPMQVPYMGIQKSDPAKRKFVYCISHSRWNDGFATKYTFVYNKRAVIPTGIHWIQIKDQNVRLATSPFGRPSEAAEWAPWEWMRDSSEEKVRFLWERMRATKRGDCSDAGMAYFLVSGDEEGDIVKLRRLLEKHDPPAPLDPRPAVRIEAENFLSLENFEVEDRNDRQASHRLNVKLTGRGGRISIPLDQPYMAVRGQYDVEIRYLAEQGGRCRFSLLVNGKRQGNAWETQGGSEAWQTHTIPGVMINRADRITVEAEPEGPAGGRLDYVQLNLKQ